ncbi:DUF418 domain-containing protein [Euzebya tangerina]|uniref:DUF418 domain-containing protein n=1 Tax=Euzebya tangerina TaxID=591198 RepID=UPI0013C2E3AC|nr:DUF418 domain-containing protein [Euzebya tangerina]
MPTIAQSLRASVRPRPDGRQPLVDALRGLALLGILLVNVEYILQSVDLGWAGFDSPTDQIVRGLIVALGQTKIFPIFALLFGYGFTIQQSRTDDAVLRQRYRRRMLGLAGLGVVHGIVFFPGDILLIYGLIGWLAFALRTWSAGRLVRCAAWVYGVAAGLWLVVGLVDLVAYTPLPAPTQQVLTTLAAGTITQVVAQHAAVWAETQLVLLLIQGPAVFAFYLIGMAVGRGDLFAAPHRHVVLFRQVIRSLGLPALVVSIVGATATIIGGRLDAIGFALGFLAAPAMAGTYLALAGLIWVRRVGRVLDLARTAGRASLSVYLAESVVATTVSYGYGLGRFGAGPAEGVLWAIGIWLVLAVATRWWLGRFRNGPLEWALRTLTYATPQPLRRPG